MSADKFDYVIVGAGAAGCVLAYRLSENPDCQVALIEAGPKDSHPFIHMPKGLAKIMATPGYLWAYESNPESANNNVPETWVRGRVLGGSSSINGMMYVRGQPQDFDGIAELSSDDWGWEYIGAAYKALETHELGASETRGDSGPLNVTQPDVTDPLSKMMVDAGASLGWTRKDDINEPDDVEGVGFAARTIHKGRRQSAATAFIHPVRHRENLHVFTDLTTDKVLFDGLNAVGVECVGKQGKRKFYASRDIILAGGAMASPGILERSGIGDPHRLEKLGIPLVYANPAVGENLIEHRGLIVQWKLKEDISHNKYYYGWRVVRSALQYLATRGGPMAAAAYELWSTFKTSPGLNRPDAQFLLAPFSFDFNKNRQDVERFPGMHLVTYPLRPTSKGSVHITSTDPEAIPELVTNYRDTPEDRETMIGAVKVARRWASQAPLSNYVDVETMPGPEYDTDEKILEAYDKFGTCGYHAVGSCTMGRDESSVVDPQLRVRGITNLRVMDTSVMPVIPSGNTNGPTMAMAWRASDVIRASAN